ncbi:hypothetical protein Plhal304r1_c005g0021201 [Plasmopara halstedii]
MLRCLWVRASSNHINSVSNLLYSFLKATIALLPPHRESSPRHVCGRFVSSTLLMLAVPLNLAKKSFSKTFSFNSIGFGTEDCEKELLTLSTGLAKAHSFYSPSRKIYTIVTAE